MGRIRVALVVATLSGSALSAVGRGQERPPSGPACVFPAPDLTAPIVVGPDDIVKRVEVVQPRDAPVRIVRIDFTGATLTTGGTFRFTHNYSLEAVNVTDQVASAISPFVWAFSGNGEGAHHAGGHGPMMDRIPLGPGQRRVLRVQGGVTEERIEAGDDVRLRVGIGWVRFATCTWNNWNSIKPQFDSQ